jgi:hypothetical protein
VKKFKLKVIRGGAYAGWVFVGQDMYDTCLLDPATGLRTVTKTRVNDVDIEYVEVSDERLPIEVTKISPPDLTPIEAAAMKYGLRVLMKMKAKNALIEAKAADLREKGNEATAFRELLDEGGLPDAFIDAEKPVDTDEEVIDTTERVVCNVCGAVLAEFEIEENGDLCDGCYDEV